MGLRVRERIHIMPVGHEFKRIVKPATKYRADRIILVTHKNNDDKGIECLNSVKEALDNDKIDYEVLECDIFELFESLETIAGAISEYQENEVYVNVSTGSKVTGIAGMIASMVMDCTAYYVRARNYEVLPSEISEYYELPGYPIDSPDVEQVTILEYISRKVEDDDPPSKGDIIYFSLQNSFEYIKDDVAGKGRYRLLDNHIIEPLVEQGYIEEIKEGRNINLVITSDGTGALSAFKWIVDSDIDWDRWIGEEAEAADS